MQVEETKEPQLKLVHLDFSSPISFAGGVTAVSAVASFVFQQAGFKSVTMEVMILDIRKETLFRFLIIFQYHT